MTTRTLARFSAAIEAATGVALIAAPDFVARVLLGAGLSSSGMAVARIAGFGLLALGFACWPVAGDAPPSTVRALFAYNLLGALYLGYLRVSGEFVAFLLWPACALHAVLAILLARNVWKSFSGEGRSREQASAKEQFRNLFQ